MTSGPEAFRTETSCTHVALEKTNTLIFCHLFCYLLCSRPNSNTHIWVGKKDITPRLVPLRIVIVLLNLLPGHIMDVTLSDV